MGRKAITEQMIREVLAKGSRTMEIPPDALLTSLAADLVRSRGLTIVRGSSVPAAATPSSESRSQEPSHGISVTGPIAIGSDHGGFQLKGVLLEYLRSFGHSVIDVGTKDETPVDYPDFAYAVGQLVATGKASLGVMIDGAGIGSCMVVNKIPGIRGACCYNEFTARNAREHNNANILTLGSRVLGTELSKSILRIFMETAFAGGRHAERVAKIGDVEKKFLR
jgi:ribose 5-phosphate isomerase B